MWARAGAEAVGGKAHVIMLYVYPFSKQFWGIQGILRQFSCQPRKRHFLRRLCVPSASDLTQLLLQRDAQACTEPCLGWDTSLQLAPRLCCGNGTLSPFSFFPRLCQDGMTRFCIPHLWMEASLADLMPMENSAQYRSASAQVLLMGKYR